MALSENIHTTAEAIVPALPSGASADQIAARNAAVTQTEKLITEIMSHIVSNIEIKGIETSLDSGTTTIESYIAGTGDHGGALSAATYPVVGSVKLNKAVTAKQTNDGKGRVS